ncbi:MAG: hypothetical protein JRD69_10050 [Deltaproteobacteria bacterium]|nr:hypothetical protein [Deltaproteobacteria bacterium]
MVEKVNIVKSAAETIDDITDSVVGIKIVGPLVDTAREIAPANVIRDLTGIPKPSEVMEDIRTRILETAGLKRFGGE